jgi:hypothetical protein
MFDDNAAVFYNTAFDEPPRSGIVKAPKRNEKIILGVACCGQNKMKIGTSILNITTLNNGVPYMTLRTSYGMMSEGKIRGATRGDYPH